MLKLSAKIRVVKWSDDPIPLNFGPGFDYLRILEEAEKKKKMLEEKLAAQREKEALERGAEEGKEGEGNGDGDGEKGEKDMKEEEKEKGTIGNEQKDVTVVRISSDGDFPHDQPNTSASNVSVSNVDEVPSQQSLVSV